MRAPFNLDRGALVNLDDNRALLLEFLKGTGLSV